MLRWERALFYALFFVLAYLLARPLLNLPPRPIRFVGENVLMDVYADWCEVRGTYRFHNPSNFSRDQKMFFVFGSSRDAEYPFAIEMASGRDGSRRNVYYRKVDNGITFTAEVPRRGVAEYEVRYMQRLRGRRAVYSVGSTKAWGRPLDAATFDVCWPKGFQEPMLSYTPIESWEQGGRVCQRIRWNNYMPKREIELSWSGP